MSEPCEPGKHIYQLRGLIGMDEEGLLFCRCGQCSLVAKRIDGAWHFTDLKAHSNESLSNH